ncbi:MAG: dienelactone hydrolase family protein [Vicinamibacteria bacterium]
MTDLKGAIVEFPANGRTARGYLSRPEKGRGPGVIVIQEWWGLVDHIRDIADRFAAEGYVALAPDLYHGEATKSPDEAGKLMMALNIEETEKDLRGAASYLLSESSGTKVGVVGFCMGGQLSLFAASKNESIGACVDFYGIHANVRPDYDRIKSPVLGLFAGKDAYVTPDAVKKLESALGAAGVTTDFHIYPDVDHGFFNDTRKEAHDAGAAADAWRRVLAFFQKHLAGEG